MATNLQEIAEAFSGHRFADTFAHLAPDVCWTAVGQSTQRGRDAVISACQDAATALAEVTTEFTRFVSVVDTQAVVIDAVAHYRDPDGQTSIVSSCDIYEFDDGLLRTITSYAVELPAE